MRNRQLNLPTCDFIAGEPINATLTAWNLGPSGKLDRDTLIYASAGRGVKSGIVTWKSTTLSGGALTPQNI